MPREPAWRTRLARWQRTACTRRYQRTVVGQKAVVGVEVVAMVAMVVGVVVMVAATATAEAATAEAGWALAAAEEEAVQEAAAMEAAEMAVREEDKSRTYVGKVGPPGPKCCTSSAECRGSRRRLRRRSS